jgi:outer membrane receptor for ferric coprogen and ferric-rhodotorulic acid
LANLTSTTRTLQIEFDGAVRGRISAIRGFDANGPMNEKVSHQVKFSNGMLSVDLGPRTVLAAKIQ